MKTKNDHKDIIGQVTEKFADLYQGSSQGMYIFLDDFHYSLNKRLLGLLGYETIDEIMSDGKAFLQKLIAPASQEKLVSAYQKAINKMAGSSLEVTWLKKSGQTLNTKVILVPFPFDGHILALHFIELNKE